MAGPAAAAARRIAREASFWARTRDAPENAVLAVMVGTALSLAVYTVGRSWFNPGGGAFWNVEQRGDMWKQADAGGMKNEGSLLWNIAQIKTDEEGYQIGIFNNRVRPHQYDKTPASKATQPAGHA